MNIDNLTFGQLWKLSHQSTLMRVTAAYHGMLERRVQWKKGVYAIASMESVLPPNLIQTWKRLLSFLTSSELKRALRQAAGKAPVRLMPGRWSDLSFCYCNDVGGHDAAHSRAIAIRFFCHRIGMPARIISVGTGLNEHFCVRVETDDIGAAAVRYHPGVPWNVLKEYTRCTPSGPERVFWWVPELFRGLVNPCLKPICTPDVGYQIEELLYGEVLSTASV